MRPTNKGSEGSHGQLEAKESLARKTERKSLGEQIKCGKGVRGSALQMPQPHYMVASWSCVTLGGASPASHVSSRLWVS